MNLSEKTKVGNKEVTILVNKRCKAALLILKPAFFDTQLLVNPIKGYRAPNNNSETMS
jgi:hypothetical protein